MILPNKRLAFRETGLRIETRAEGEPPRIVGHAAVFNEWTTLYEGRSYRIRERLVPGCFDNALAEKQDVRCLLNHDANYVLGRTRSGTLELSVDERGLLSSTNPPETQLVRDMVLSPIGRGDMSGMSFGFDTRKGGFRTSEYEADDGLINYDLELLDLDLFDVSVVVYPAYEGTDVGLRSNESLDDFLKTFGLPRPEPASPEAGDAHERARRSRARMLAMFR